MSKDPKNGSESTSRGNLQSGVGKAIMIPTTRSKSRN